MRRGDLVWIAATLAMAFASACSGSGGNVTADGGVDRAAGGDAGSDVPQAGSDAIDAGESHGDVSGDGDTADAGGDVVTDAEDGATDSAGDADTGPTFAGCSQIDNWVNDFDGDGRADCVQGQNGATKLSLVFHKGVAPDTYRVAGVVTPDILETSHHGIGAFDLNDDGRADILVGMDDPMTIGPVQPMSYVQIFRGQTDGTFVPWAPPAGTPSWVLGLGGVAGLFVVNAPPLAGDFDGDGAADLVTVTAAPNLYSHFFWLVLKSSGGLDFGTKQSDGLSSFRGVATIDGAGDLNRDGKLDIVITMRANPVNSQVWQIATALNNGDGTFAATTVVPGTDNTTGLISIGDVNGDTKPDLLVALPAGHTPFYGDGAGHFSTTAP